MLTHIDLFSGIGGFALAAQWAGFKTVVFCEIEPFCREVLKKHWPGIPIIPDVKNFRWPLADSQIYAVRNDSENKGKINRKEHSFRNPSLSSRKKITLLTGGFPCQPFSLAGKRRGKRDDRYLWPEMFRIITQVRPDWIIAENPIGIVSLAIDEVLSDLESEDYCTKTFNIPACAVEAPHERKRIFIVAYSDRFWKLQQNRSKCQGREWPSNRNSSIPNDDGARQKDIQGIGPEEILAGRRMPYENGWWDAEPAVGRVAYGIPSRVDRLKALGNAIVPQVAYEIIKEIASIEQRIVQT